MEYHSPAVGGDGCPIYQETLLLWAFGGGGPAILGLAEALLELRLDDALRRILSSE